MNPDAPTGPAAASAHASSDIASWFRDEKELLARVQRVVLAPVPSVVGCDHLREISRGGQGIVYEGVQVGTRRKVAVKVLSDASVTSRRGLLRFQREADLAAGLSHPGIVRIYDSGVTPAGQAYIVMEFVEGIPLDAWTQQRHDDVPALLHCFARICDAVQHAHTRGVIHRDLKPSNILVDSDNQPRVLDFGLAKALRDHTTGAEPRAHPQNATVTAQGQFVGSLPFASPEQVRGEALDIRSDVYSLGVILHHALTGNLPIDVRRSLDQALRAIVEEAPTPLRRQRSTLHEELEVIALTALAKDPAHRYQSALALASDVRAHLAGEPIAARRESAWRALRRRAARQRVLAWAGLAVLSITVGATLVSTSALRAAQRDRDAATQARARSDAASQFLTDILGAANPMRDGGGRDAKVADQLALASAQIDARFPDDPLTRAALRDVLGQAYAQLSLLPEARAEFAAALAALEALADAPPALAPDADDAHLDLRIRGNVAGLRAMEEGWPAALSEFESVVAAYESRGVTRSESFASTLSDLGVCLRNLSRYDDAAAAYDRALAALPTEALEGKTHSTILLNQATLVEVMRTAQEALPLMERALAMQERAFGPESMQTLTAQSNLGFLLIEVGRPADGVAMLRKAMETCERIAGESAPTTLILMNNLAKALLDMGELDEAQRVFERCIAIYDRDRPTDARITAPLGSLGFLFAQRRDHEAALRISERALDVEVRLRGENTPDWITALNNMGVSLDRVGRLAESEEYLRKAVRFSAPEAGILPAGNFRHHVYRITLANTLTAQGKLDEAIALIRDAQQKLRESVGESHWAYDAAVRSLAKWEAKKAAQP